MKYLGSNITTNERCTEKENIETKSGKNNVPEKECSLYISFKTSWKFETSKLTKGYIETCKQKNKYRLVSMIRNKIHTNKIVIKHWQGVGEENRQNNLGAK